MAILILSPDQEASTLLCSALARRGAAYVWHEVNDSSDELPSVAIVDARLPGYEGYLQKLLTAAPWCRRYLMGTPETLQDSDAERANVRVVHKPFDAAGLAQLLVQESKLAELAKDQRGAQTKADELALLVQSTFEAIIGLDADLGILSWNSGASDIYGFHAEEVLGKPISVLSEGIEAPTSELRPGEKRAEETRRRHKDGRELTLLVSRSRITGQPQESALEYAEVSLDISSQRRMQRDLEQSQRLATLGRISATMSHEINNPLAVIRSCAAWLNDFAERSKDNELSETAEDLELASERIAGFVDQMCGLARRMPTELKLAPLSKTLEPALRMIRPRAMNRKVRLALTDMHLAGTQVAHDVGRLSQAIINVVANAIDAAADGGGDVWFRLVQSERAIRIIVEDNGPGIAPEMEGRLFEPFSTTKPFGLGTGLGLALTREVLLEHHGMVQLMPRPNGGTVAELTLPLSPRHATDVLD